MSRRALICFLASIVPAGAQVSPAGASSPWKRIVIPYSATPVIDLKQGTAYQITLTGATATATFTNIAKADGRAISFLVCQDATGNRVFNYPESIYGTADISPIPGRCTAQTFLVAGSQIWATSTGASQSNVPAPSILKAPLVGGSYMTTSAFAAQQGMTLTNESGGVLIKNTAAVAGGWVNAFGQLRGALNPMTIQATYWVEEPPAGTTVAAGIFFTDGTSSHACEYRHGNGVNEIRSRSAHTSWGLSDPPWAAAATIGTVFTNANTQVFLKLLYPGTIYVVCSYSLDFGATWNSFTAGSSWNGDSAVTWGIGGEFTDTAQRIHLTSVSVN